MRVRSAGRLPRRLGGDDGLAIVLVSAAMVAIVLIAALVVDVGYARSVERESQATADAAALAAAQVWDAKATNQVAAATEARSISMKNTNRLTDAAWAACTDPDRPAGYAVDAATTSITGQCVSFDATNQRVRVRIPTVQTPGFLGSMVRGRYDIGTSAIAEVIPGSGGTGTCGICAIDGGEFQQAGNANVKIDGARRIEADNLRINANGNANRPTTLAWYARNWSNNDKYTYVRLAQPVANPFADVVVDYKRADGTTVRVSSVMNARCGDLRPDEMYPQTVDLQGSCTLTRSGNYYFRNGLQVSGSLKVADGVKVTLIFGCATGTQPTDRATKCNGQNTGNVNFNGSGKTELGEPFYGGVSMLWDETARGDSVINYNGNVTMGGAFYARWSSPAFGNGTFEATAIVYGKGTGTQNGGNIQIVSPAGGGTGGGQSTISLYR